MSRPVQTILFVCLGNICRSPTAHAVFRQKVGDKGLTIEIESAGTASYHIGALPDKRSMRHGQKRGYDFSGLTARAVKDSDFEYYDFILAMDHQNYTDLMNRCPVEYQTKVQHFLDYAKNFSEQREVPDPYYGGSEGFEYVLDLIEDASDGLIEYLKK